MLSFIDRNWDEWQERWREKTKRLVKGDAFCLDVGTGNGLFVLRLARLGFRHLDGIDYVDTAIAVARKSKELLSNKEEFREAIKVSRIEFRVEDIVDEEVNDAPQRYDLVHDKGTLDVFVLKKGTSQYFKGLLTKYVEEGSLLVVTSCNLTLDELVEEASRHSYNQLGLKVIDKDANAPQFTFGGRQGQAVATVCCLVTRDPQTRPPPPPSHVCPARC